MTLGALLDAGLPLDDLKAALGSLALGEAELRAEKVLRTGVSATKFSVVEHPAPGSQPPVHVHRHLPKIFKMVDESALAPASRERAKAMFQRLGEAEAAIHQMPVEKVHLHEVGALDSIIDIVGTVFAMEWAGADRVVCSPLNVGGGMVTAAHGVFPVPAPATVRLLGDAPVYSGAVQKELVTPTGALIATTYASSFGPIPAMKVERVGYGAGDRDDPVTPNVLRVMIGEEQAVSAAGLCDRVTVIECEIDDMNPQLFGVVMDRLYAAGALEVFYIPVQMKKNRPGTLLTVVAPPPLRTVMTEIVFRETTTIGLRHRDVDRECLERAIVVVETAVGSVRVKVASRSGQVLNATPEFEDCAKLATAHNLPVKEVQALAMKAYRP
jgi:pyridinium-3,5-bisthiocarboxylic acid mononucleotide nickel chelatase